MKALVVDVTSGGMFEKALRTLTPVEVKVLMAHLSNMDEDRHINYAGSALSESYKVSRQSISRATKSLVNAGILLKSADGCMWKYEVNKAIGTKVTATKE